MKLYEATVTIYVVANDLAAARHVAAFDADVDWLSWEVDEAVSVEADWWDKIPWGDGPDDKTCGEYVKPQTREAAIGKAPLMVPTTAEEEGA